MPPSAILLAGAILLAASPLAAQAGLVAPAASVTLTAVRQPSISVGVTEPGGEPAAVAVRTAWNVDRERPTVLELVAFVDLPMLASVRPAGGTRSMQVVDRPRAPAGKADVFLLFRQSIGTGDALGTRSEVLELRPGAGTLNLTVITQ